MVVVVVVACVFYLFDVKVLCSVVMFEVTVVLFA